MVHFKNLVVATKKDVKFVERRNMILQYKGRSSLEKEDESL